MFRRVVRAMRVRLRDSKVRRRCVIAPGAVVYEPDRIVATGGDRASIRIGADSHVRGELLTLPGGSIEMGAACYLGEHSHVWAAQRIEIGDRVLIAHNVSIFDNLTHPLNPFTRRDHFHKITHGGHPRDVDLEPRPVIIEDDVWIACNCVVLRGVRIGRGAVIGAGSVVTKDIPPYVLAAGNPTRVLRSLTLQEQQEARTRDSAIET